ncbi:MAG TPA: GNAT family N-acetyltransferase [Hyphomonas sp.]|nr:GNAT family N-acetyltransferase [Hyphomonas sp.]MCB9970572.1 GNAT family N-acetyltransferase [Hyphomonas sp.]HPE48826.1 GNAT family N-acetyltransferase [Hyphomonas sp.]
MYAHDGAGWHIREFETHDGSACMSIFMACLREFPWRGSPRPYVARLIRSLPGSRIWVAEEPSAGIIGFVTLQPASAYVDHLFVDEDWRFCGVGRGLLHVARESAGRPLTLDVDTKNTGARKAYKSLGWHVAASAGEPGTAGHIRLVSP